MQIIVEGRLGEHSAIQAVSQSVSRSVSKSNTQRQLTPKVQDNKEHDTHRQTDAQRLFIYLPAKPPRTNLECLTQFCVPAQPFKDTYRAMTWPIRLRWFTRTQVVGSAVLLVIQRQRPELEVELALLLRFRLRLRGGDLVYSRRYLQLAEESGIKTIALRRDYKELFSSLLLFNTKDSSLNAESSRARVKVS